ncbi:MAG: adenylate/guanylate cyclase domain-containing protein [Acidimicrobiales bacterium]
MDLSGFTTFVERNGLDRASEELTLARSTIRILTSTHGVRVDKWLGDGALIIGTVTTSVLRAVLEIEAEVDANGALPLRAGITTGPAMVFEGDDYIGGPLNLAAKLCHLAGPGQVLVPAEMASRYQGDVAVVSRFSADVPGIGMFELAELRLPEAVDEGLRKAE